jgi:hypothetical protein
LQKYGRLPERKLRNIVHVSRHLNEFTVVTVTIESRVHALKKITAPMQIFLKNDHSIILSQHTINAAHDRMGSPC